MFTRFYPPVMPVQQLDWAGAGDREESLSASDVPQDCDFEVDFFTENEREKNNLYLDENENICADHGNTDSGYEKREE